MSLFSRLDRVRDKAKLEAEAEEGVFAVPNLGPRDAQETGRRPVVPATEPPIAEAPVAEPSALETPVAEAPVAEVPFLASTPSLDSALAMPASAEEDTAIEADIAPSIPATDETVDVPQSLDTAAFAAVQLPPVPEATPEATPTEYVAPEPSTPEAASSTEVPEAPVSQATISQATVPEAVAAPPARTTFDRLMAESAEDEEETVPTPALDEAPISSALPWEASSAQPARQEAPTPPAMAEPLPDFLSSAPTPQAEPLPDFLSSAPAPEVTPPPAPEAVEAQAPAPAPVVPVPASPVAPEVASAPPSAEQATPLGRPAPVPITRERPINSGLGVRTPVDRLAERPTMENPVPDRPSVERPPVERPPVAPAPAERPFNNRFAGRAGLDRDVEVGAPLARTSEPTAAPDNEPSRAPLARVENDAAQSEREAKNRSIYRRKHLMFDSVLGSIDPRQLQNPTRDSLRPAIEKGVDGALREFNLALEPAERNWLIEEFLRETTDFGPLVSLLDDPGVNKILVSGSSDVTIEKLGRMERTGISFRDDDHLLSIIRRLAETVGGRIDAKVPLLDRPLPDGARVRAKIPPMAPQPTLTLEKSTGNPFVVLKRQQAERGRGDNLPYAQLRERIQQRLVREFEGDSLSTGNTDRLRGQVEEMINAVILEERVAVTRAERAALVMDLLNEIVGLGPIEPLLNDPEVDEVMVNGPYQIYVERKGKLELSPQRFRDNNHVMQVIDRIVAPLGRRIDEKSPMVDGRLRDGSRFNAIIPPLALSGPTMTIRKFARDPFTMTDLINFGTLSRDAAQFLQAAVEGRLNIMVSGGTGSGKTTTLNVLSSFIPTTERIVTIEDAAELQLRQEHVIRLETRPPNIEGIGEVGIRDLVRNSLRMRPDRIVVGECRGGEALDMLQAMNTGHDGSLTTGHSNGPRDTLKRLETMVMMAGFDLPVRAIREQISMAVQIIVHQERMRDGKRRITAITELVGMEGDVITMQDIFRFEQERVDDEGRIVGALVPTGLRPKNFDTIVDNGVELSMELFHPRSMGEHGVRSRLDQRMSTR